MLHRPQVNNVSSHTISNRPILPSNVPINNKVFAEIISNNIIDCVRGLVEADYS